jgi:hypothetical protein
MSAPTNFEELKAAVQAWLDNADIDAAECITLAEARFNRILASPDMEARGTIALADGIGSLPANFLEARSLTIASDPVTRLEPLQLEDVIAAQGLTGAPRFYCITGTQIYVAPNPDADVAIGIVYRRTVPPLATSRTNWLLARHPDLYIAAAVAVAEFKGWNDERLPLVKAWYDEILGEITSVDRRKRGPVRLRAPVSERV